MKLFAIFGFVAASNLGANGARLADLTLRTNGAQEEGLTIVPPPPVDPKYYCSCLVPDCSDCREGYNDGRPGYIVPGTGAGNGYNPYNPAPPVVNPGCRTVALTEKSIIYVKKTVQVCQDVKTIECGTCLEELGAKNSTKVKGISQCEVKYKYLAVDFPRHTETVLEDTVCHNIPQQVCNSHWVVDAKGDKVWEQDPSTCQTFEVTQCTKVPKPKTSVDYVTSNVSRPSAICCQVVRDVCTIKHTNEPQQQEVTRYKEVCDVTYDAAPAAYNAAPAVKPKAIDLTSNIRTIDY